MLRVLCRVGQLKLLHQLLLFLLALLQLTLHLVDLLLTLFLNCLQRNGERLYLRLKLDLQRRILS